MALETASDFAAAVRDLALLDDAALTELEQLARTGREPQWLAQEAVARGWITSWQSRVIMMGRGPDMVLGSYLLLEMIGEGGMGKVFKARHRLMGRLVALKVIRKERLENRDAVRRFRREIQAAAQLHHPNIVIAFDADQVEDRHYFAMEFVDGTDLSRLVQQRGPLPQAEACDYIRQAALGLQHAFERGLVHRDIKPSNLLLTISREEAVRAALSGTLRTGSMTDAQTPRGVIKILDMGLARIVETAAGEEPSRLTREGVVIGTPDFLAPEQARNASKVDIRADLYGLGCTMFFLLTGQVPYPGGTPTEKLLKHATDPIPSVRGLQPEVSEALATLVTQLMAKRPDDRPATPAELAASLEALTTNSATAHPSSTNEAPLLSAAPRRQRSWWRW